MESQPPPLAGLGVRSSEVGASPQCGGQFSVQRNQSSGLPVGPSSSATCVLYSDNSVLEEDDLSELRRPILPFGHSRRIPSRRFRRLFPCFNVCGQTSLQSRGQAYTPLSAIASALARAPGPSSVTTLSLLKSAHVINSLSDALATVRGSAELSAPADCFMECQAGL